MAVIHSSPVYPDQVAVRRDLINVFFRLMDGKTLCLHIDPLRDDMITVKKQIAAKSDFRSNDLFFVWNGKPLENSQCTASYYGLRDGATVMVSYRNRGGCFIVSFSILCIIGAAIIGSTCTCGMSLCVVPFLLPLLFILPLFCL